MYKVCDIDVAYPSSFCVVAIIKLDCSNKILVLNGKKSLVTDTSLICNY